ncbi:MAG: LysR family transcriptional regulator [Lachnospiraceae bacterium]|nr:LysR family transcriptional regulator [Lachnospiraceae bacterium]
MLDINLEYYKIFYYVGKLKNITLAAEELSVSQPAVSQALRHLEEALGSPLFVRTSKGVRFTPEGEMMYSFVQRGYEYICQGERKFKEMLDLENGEIRIGASDMTLQFYLLEVLEQFHESYPGIKVAVTNAPTPETLRHLQDGQIDFGVVSTPIQLRHGWEMKRVRKVEDVFVAGKKFQYLKGQILSYHQLESLPILCLEKNTSTRNYVDDFLEKNNVVLRPEFELANSNMLIQFARKGLGIASVVRDFTEEFLEKEELFLLEFDQKIPKREFCVVTDQRIPVSAAAGKLLKMIENI